MEIIAGLALSLIAMILLAAVGLTTVVALGLMMALGLLTNMSFKRLFFVSFAMGLAAPVMLGAATFAAIEDGSFERDLRRDLGGIVQLPDDRGENWGVNLGGAISELQQIGRDVDSGDLTEEQAEQRVRDILAGTDDGSDPASEDGADEADGAEEAAGEAVIETDDNSITVDIDGVQLSRDGDSVQIEID